MPVEQGLPWHPVATGLAGQAIPFVVAASHAHALPSAPFWFPVPAVLVASPASLCPSSLSAVLARVPPGVAPAFCVSVLLLPRSVGAPECPFRAPPPVPPACPPVRGFHISVRRGLSRARLAGQWPCCHLPARGAQPPPLWSTRAPCRGRRGCLLTARSACAAFGGCRRACTSWFPCVFLCVLLGLVSLPCVGRLCNQLLVFLPISGSSFFCWHAHRCWCAAPGGAACRSLPPIVAVGLSHFQLGGTRGTGHFCTCLQIYTLTCHWCLLGLFCGECDALLLFCKPPSPSLASPLHFSLPTKAPKLADPCFTDRRLQDSQEVHPPPPPAPPPFLCG